MDTRQFLEKSPIDLLPLEQKTPILAAIRAIEAKKGRSYAPTTNEIETEMALLSIFKPIK